VKGPGAGLLFFLGGRGVGGLGAPGGGGGLRGDGVGGGDIGIEVEGVSGNAVEGDSGNNGTGVDDLDKLYGVQSPVSAGADG
jgi:hypothetical protein